MERKIVGLQIFWHQANILRPFHSRVIAVIEIQSHRAKEKSMLKYIYIQIGCNYHLQNENLVSIDIDIIYFLYEKSNPKKPFKSPKLIIYFRSSLIYLLYLFDSK